MKKEFLFALTLSFLLPLYLRPQEKRADLIDQEQVSPDQAHHENTKKCPEETRNYSRLLWLFMGSCVGAFTHYLFSKDDDSNQQVGIVTVEKVDEKQKTRGSKIVRIDESTEKKISGFNEKRKSLTKKDFGIQILQTIIESFQKDDDIEFLLQLEEVKKDGKLKRLLESYLESAHNLQGLAFQKLEKHIHQNFEEPQIDQPSKEKDKRKLPDEGGSFFLRPPLPR